MRIIPAFLCLWIVGCAEEIDDAAARIPVGPPVEFLASAALLELGSDQKDGEQLFNVFCWSCHGRGGHGDGPAVGTGQAPPNFMQDEYAGLSAWDLEERLRPGEAGGPGTSDHMRYVRSIVDANKFSEALSYIPALVYPVAIPGSALRGRDLYTENCLICHGATGAGDGDLGMSLPEYRPADFTSDTLVANQDWEALLLKIQDGGAGRHTAMPSFASYFSEGETWDLVAYIATLQPGVLPSLIRETGG